MAHQKYTEIRAYEYSPFVLTKLSDSYYLKIILDYFIQFQKSYSKKSVNSQWKMTWNSFSSKCLRPVMSSQALHFSISFLKQTQDIPLYSARWPHDQVTRCRYGHNSLRRTDMCFTFVTNWCKTTLLAARLVVSSSILLHFCNLMTQIPISTHVAQ